MKINTIHIGLLVALSLIVGGATNAFATSTPTTTPRVDIQTSPVYLSCVKTAVTIREAGVITAWNAYTATSTSAYTTHQSAVLAAWNMTDARNAERAETLADQTLRKSLNFSEKIFRQSKESLNKTFRESKQACRPYKRPQN